MWTLRMLSSLKLVSQNQLVKSEKATSFVATVSCYRIDQKISRLQKDVNQGTGDKPLSPYIRNSNPYLAKNIWSYILQLPNRGAAPQSNRAYFLVRLVSKALS